MTGKLKQFNCAVQQFEVALITHQNLVSLCQESNFCFSSFCLIESNVIDVDINETTRLRDIAYILQCWISHVQHQPEAIQKIMNTRTRTLPYTYLYSENSFSVRCLNSP